MDDIAISICPNMYFSVDTGMTAGYGVRVDNLQTGALWLCAVGEISNKHGQSRF
jgi:hypothetical protein